MGNMREIIRSNLERYLSESGYTQKEFAEKLGVSKSSVTNWVKGKNSPDVDLVVPICKLLNITIKDFYSDSSLVNFEPQENTKKELPTVSDEERLDQEIIRRLVQLTPEELEKVDAFVQGLLAAR